MIWGTTISGNSKDAIKEELKSAMKELDDSEAVDGDQRKTALYCAYGMIDGLTPGYYTVHVGGGKRDGSEGDSTISDNVTVSIAYGQDKPEGA